MPNRFTSSGILLLSLLSSVSTSACSFTSGREVSANTKRATDLTQPTVMPSVTVSPVAVVSPSVPSAPSRRFIVALLDVSRSFLDLNEAVRQIERIVAAAGPGDTLLIAKITGSFDPRVNIVIERVFPELRADLLKIPRTLREQNEQQAALNAAWRAVAARREEILQAIRPITPEASRTDCDSALAYSMQRFKQAGSDGLLFIFSDLEQDAHGVKSMQPPKANAVSLKGVQVKAMFVPWHNASAWAKLEQAWQDWATACSAQSFSIHDSGQSLQMQLLTPNSAPKTVPSVVARKGI